MMPYTAMLDVQRQAWENAAETMSKLGSAPDAAETMETVDVGQTPNEVVYEENKLKLRHYESRTDEQHDVPILVVYALINKPYILDLQPDRSVVRTLLDQGYDVYMIDWGEPSNLDVELGLDDYVNRYIDNCVDVVRDRSGLDSINVLGYCMGGTMSVMYAALHAEKVRNLGLMAAGLCFDRTGGVLELWGDDDYYSPRALKETFGNVPSEFLDVGFALMDPVENSISKYVRLYENMDDEDFVENFARMERWIGDGIDVAGRAYVEFLEDIYQENKLYENELELGGRKVDLNNLEMPILQIVAEYDHLIPPEASKPFNEVVPSDDATVMEFPTGHIGMSVSSRSHAELWPQVCDWFEQRSVVDDDRTVDAESGVEIEIGEETEAGEGTVAAEESVDVDLEDISGIGPAYADRLRDAGVTDVRDLATADAAALADSTGVSESRLEDWIDQASQFEA